MWSCTMFRGIEHGTVGGGRDCLFFFFTVGIVGVEGRPFCVSSRFAFLFLHSIVVDLPFS